MVKNERPKTPARAADDAPLFGAAAGAVDTRVVEAWDVWLSELATNAEAAMAAAMAYKELDEAARGLWLDALDQDATRVGVPLIAVYAPLLAVESDPARRERIAAALGEPGERPATPPRALVGTAPDGSKVATIVAPLYLDFVQVLACGFRSTTGFAWVRHDPIVGASGAPRPGEQVRGVRVESTPLKPLVDELALAVLAHVRSGEALPEALRIFADLFEPTPDPAPPAA